VIEAIMVALSSAMCAFFLIYFDPSCQVKGKDPNKHPLQVNDVQGFYTAGFLKYVYMKKWVN